MSKKQASIPKDNHLLPNMVTPCAFSKLVDKSRRAIYYHIQISKKIEVIFVGMNRDMYLDYNKYKDFDFK